MDNEKYGIELELITNKFKQKMQEVKNAFKGVENKKINVNTNTAQIEYVKSQIKEIQYLLSRADKGFEVGDTLKLEAKLEKLNNQYNRLISSQNKLSVSSSKATTGLSKGLDKMTSKIKRFGLSLLSIRSIWALLSRASSAYLAQDTELANKLQSVWAGLGALLSPIIEGIVNILAKAVAYINIFIKALTGVDLLAKASAKSMKAAAGSARSLNKALAGFDELQNLDTDAGGGTGGIGGALSDFENLDLPWADKIEKFAEKLKTVYDWLHKIGGDKGAIENFKELYERLKVIHGETGAIQNFKEIYEKLKAIGGEKGAYQNFKLIKEKLDEIGLGQGAFQNFKRIYDKLKEIGGDRGAINNFQALWNKMNEAGGVIDKIKIQFEGWKSNIRLFTSTVSGWLSGMWNGLINGARISWNWIVGQFNGWKANIYTFVNTIANLFSNLWRSILRSFSNSWNKIANALNKVGGKFGMTTLPTINSYAVGTNYVPEDQLALIHKGEAVVPKKYNNGGYVPQSNDETNYLLEQVITAINNIEINPYTTVKDVGKASLSYINAKSRQLGESVVV